MKVSVIIPTHNRPQLLTRAILSLYNQTRTPDEIIVVDDGSEESMETYSKGSIITFHRHEKSLGACAARNKGAELATGNILMFLDDDDLWEPTKINDQLKVFKENPDVGLVYSGRVVSKDILDGGVPLFKIPPTKKGYLYPEILHGNIIGTTSSVAIKKRIFDKVGGFDERFPALQDYDLWIRACKLTKVSHDGKCNVKYMLATDPTKQLSGQQNRHKKAINLIMKKYEDEINKQGKIGKRKVYSSLYFMLAKNIKKNSYLRSIPYNFKSLLYFPRIKNFAFFLPDKLINILRGYLSS